MNGPGSGDEFERQSDRIMACLTLAVLCLMGALWAYAWARS